MLTIEILSSNLKATKVKIAPGEKKKNRGNIVKEDKPAPVYVTFDLSITDGTDALPIHFAISDCRLSEGILRPPARPGGWSRNFFPQVWFTQGLDNAMADQLYLLCKELAATYNVPLLPQAECLQTWVPSAKITANFKNLTKEIITRE